MEGKHYDAIDGLRMIACFGIVMMHVRASCSYDLSGFIYDKVISSFTNFVFLFMTVSASSGCRKYHSNWSGLVPWTNFCFLHMFSILLHID